MAGDARRRLLAHGYELVVDPVHGGSLTALRWRGADGCWIDILHPCPPGDVARSGGSFIMAPFANRLDGGRFPTPEGVVNVPINRPEQDMAVHGFSRDRAWTIVAETNDTLTLVDRFVAPSIAFAYELTQQIALIPTGVTLSLELENRAPRTLPYGFGFHPWFRKGADTRLAVATEGFLGRDDRGFPTAPIAGPDFARGLDLPAMDWFDGHAIGWADRRAILEWPEDRMRLELTATGALTNLHIYVPDDLPVFCVEPVSHVPDVHNRRHLAALGDLAWLAPQQSMEGSMTLRCQALSR